MALKDRTSVVVWKRAPHAPRHVRNESDSD
jgi:hypothetical protein